MTDEDASVVSIKLNKQYFGGRKIGIAKIEALKRR